TVCAVRSDLLDPSVAEGSRRFTFNTFYCGIEFISKRANKYCACYINVVLKDPFLYYLCASRLGRRGTDALQHHEVVLRYSTTVGGPRVVPKAEPVKETAVAEEVPTRAPAGETADEQAAREAKEDEAAATKVQSLYRGKRDRAEVQAKMQAKKEQEERERAEEEEAATRVQALYKGKKARAKVQNMKEVKYASADANAASGDDAEA
ncbi:unnamed protein product, partial [Amoebophrya sp. A120]